MRKDVREVIDLCRSLGLEPMMESGSGHYKVRDPNTGAYVFGISSSPSDPNWRWMIMRHLRRLGLLRRDERGKKSKGFKRKAAVDLLALKKAQDQAASMGERIPMLEDLDDRTFFTKILNNNVPEYSEDAMSEVTELMAVKPNDPRANAVRQRLERALENHREKLQAGNNAQLRAQGKREHKGMGEIEEFLRIAIEEVGPQRNIRTWPNTSAARQTLNTFRKAEKGIAAWSLDIIEATIDHIDGLRWNKIDPERKRVSAPPESQFKVEPPVEAEVVETIPKEVEDALLTATTAAEQDAILPILEVTTEDHIRERYAEALLEILKTEGSKTAEPVLSRLDKLAGIA